MEVKRRFAMLICTWFGVGLVKFAPGSWASLFALPFAWVIYEFGQLPALAVATLLVFAVGVWVANIYTRNLSEDDPPQVVIDEVAGQWLTLLVVPPSFLYYMMGCIFFRITDILKPWPIAWADKHIKGGLGIMFDDILAGVYAALALFAFRLWID